MSEHDASTEQAIRERAYALWEADGQPEGAHDAYWLRAERELGAHHAHANGGADEVEAQSADGFPASDAPTFTGVTGP